MVGLEEPLGVRDTIVGREGGVVHHVTEERRQLLAVNGFGRLGAGFGELSRDASDLHGGNTGGVGQHNGHLQDDPQLLADGDGIEAIEGLSAVACLEEEGLTLGHAGQLLLQGASFAGKDEGRHRGQILLHSLEFGRVRPARLVLRWESSP